MRNWRLAQRLLAVMVAFASIGACSDDAMTNEFQGEQNRAENNAAADSGALPADATDRSDAANDDIARQGDTGPTNDILNDDGEIDTQDESLFRQELLITLEAAGIATEIAADPMSFAASLDEERYILQDAEGQLYITQEGEPTEPLDSELGTVFAAVILDVDGEPTFLAAAENGLFAFQDETMVLSPLSELMEDPPVRQLVVHERGDNDWLWMATEDHVWLFRDGQLQSVDADTLSTADAIIAAGGEIDGEPALWLGTADALMGLLPEDDDSLTLAVLRENLPIDALQTDTDGNLWLLSEGELHWRQQDGDWQWFGYENGLDGLASGKPIAGCWIHSGDELFYRHDGAFMAVTTDIHGDFLGTDHLGRAMISTENGLMALAIDSDDINPPLRDDPPTWSGDIAPLSQIHCTECHGANGFAHPMYEFETWVAEIENITYMVTNNQMPLPPKPPLDDDSIQLILDWQQAGFPE